MGFLLLPSPLELEQTNAVKASVTDPGAVVGLGLQICDFSDLSKEVGLLHPGLGPSALELSPRVGEDHLEVHRET